MPRPCRQIPSEGLRIKKCRENQRFYYGIDKQPIHPINRDYASPGAYYFRSISDEGGDMKDPLDGTSSDWKDYKPITGENAWGALIGPLQVAFAEYGDIPPMESDAVKLALNILPALQAMTGPEGGLFYAPWNTAGNQAGTIADPLSLSAENNFSSRSGLTMLKQVLDTNQDATYLPQVTRSWPGSISI